MNLAIFIALLGLQSTEPPKNNCAQPQTSRDVAICQNLKQLENFEIISVDKVAFGANNEIFSLKPVARACLLINQVDPINAEQSFFRVVNASAKSKNCLLKWIRANKPHLEWTAAKQKELEGFVQ